ncbi:MAG: trypsin-like peptidase domain-containing protein [Sphingobacterium sp.]|uniref:trypsin-like peptidase domain-containing protein n=1 Tax=Sphingobacterium sp. TaxID=341027 RepID=UPI0028437D9A|nr:trypsin-like peptidase domain-containing protein [Sphingobacterium sp.]MDR3008302.1 trypsin-like peptidase domain-containing protein [Sphingobacterium sp.]
MSLGHDIPKSTLFRAMTASIKMFGIDSTSGQQNSAPFSGVIVSVDGAILTVAHSTKPGNFYRVIFPDGKQGVAKALGRLVVDQQSNLPDIAMMKMQGEGPWPFAEMGWSSSIAENQFCFGLSYPETLPFYIPFLRTGRILKKMDDYGFIQSSSIMEPGDSGGPLFDALGRVIGLHSRIDSPEGINFEVPVNSYRKYWQSLSHPVAIDTYPSLSDSIGSDPEQQKLLELALKKQAKHPKTNFQSIRISSILKDDSISILGTVFQLRNKKQVILSKSSLVGKAPIVKIGKKVYALKVLLRDEKSDLVALTGDHKFPSIAISEIAQQGIPDTLVGLNLWSLLTSNQRKTGVLGMSSRTFPRIPVPGTFDAQMRELDGLPTLTKVDSMGAAAHAGLQVGDHMIALNGHDVASAVKINAAMQQFSAGDTLQVQYRRGAADFHTKVILSKWPTRENPHPANNIPKGKSVRRDHFPSVFLHDSRIHADECGSPIVDSNGHFIGINIARFSHTACLAIPRDAVLKFLSNVEQLL